MKTKLDTITPDPGEWFIHGKELAQVKHLAKTNHKEHTRDTLEEEFRHLASELSLDMDIFSDGPLNSEVVLVGEGAGETEVRTGKPFTGGSGNLLWDSLRRYKLNRTNVYTTNVVKRQISLSRKGNEKHVVLRDELDKWIGLLEWELSQLPNARVIFVLGNYALEAVARKYGITNWRGSVFTHKLPNGKLGKIVCANNPAYALRELKQEPVFQMDCHKLNLAYTNTFKEYEIDELINPSFKEVMAFLRDLSRSREPIALDVEHPPSLGPETVCYGLANSSHRAMCINFRDATKNRFDLSQEYSIYNAIQQLCDSHKIVAQSGGHEIYWCWLKDRIKIKTWMDTLLAHHCLYPQLPHSLQFLTAQYTTHPFYKDEGEDWKESQDFDMLWRYNCKDAAITYHAARKLESELKVQKLDKFFFNHVMRAQNHVAQATVHGVAVDLSIKEQIVQQCNEDTQKLKNEFYRIVQELLNDDSYYPNPNSPMQLKELFFEYLSLKGRGLSTDKTNREHIMKNPATGPQEKEMLVALDRYISEDKFLGTFAESKLSHDKRFRTDYKQYGVARAPGRLSSAQLIDGTGGNMQNQPLRARSMYVSDPGCVLVYFDAEQAEARIVAYRANIPKWKEQFERARIDGSYDCHRALASEMFKIPYNEVPKEDFTDEQPPRPTVRFTSKRCRHGLNYRMERHKLAEVTGLPYHEAARAFALYHSITPELRRWWDQEEKEFKRNREQYNAFGRRNKLIQRLDEDALSTVIAFYPQSTLGDKIVQVWYQAEEDDDWPSDARVAINVHDSLVAIATPKSAKTVARILKKHAESPILIQDAWKRHAEKLIIPAAFKLSYKSSPKFDKKGRLIDFVRDDKNGFHRWSHMDKIKF